MFNKEDIKDFERNSVQSFLTKHSTTQTQTKICIISQMMTQSFGIFTRLVSEKGRGISGHFAKRRVEERVDSSEAVFYQRRRRGWSLRRWSLSGLFRAKDR
ncbi:hypothetical protein CDAR_246671 [Caerostris darwini]|uniref:Uncharacterized protein n=1 Tax=Caerostris darwini TaxID=1538125 RepID=A0AAV4TDB0_9ARAC|nr:hypothetical protein CDAR_246671 [Caerostris darwini]